MQQVISNKVQEVFLSNIYTNSNAAKSGLFKRFINWCAGQEKNRFLWVGISLLGLIGMMLPLTALSIL
ncbi:MAG TPA: hypothetical protein PL045_09730, partial [Chitinophagaceae bacterium]|nr:hypothetical protein [Chitinophagaceae bacterium]